uniref:Reverse transcriptase domain-containing protein n=1 Tax=Anisakis simplex TaxID=6269 RepID=A0A0M3K8S7_ANISI
LRGKDNVKDRDVAIKVEPIADRNDKQNDPRRLVLEQNVLIAIRKKPYLPLIFASGKTIKGYPFIVMQMLGKNLTDLRKRRDEKRFTASTAFRVAEQIEITLSKLPWAKSSPREMLRMKENMSIEEICNEMPEPFIECYKYINELKSNQFPEHIKMHNYLNQCRPSNTKTDDPYDWEIENFYDY